MSLKPFKVEKVSLENQKEMIAFLKQHENTSLFLLGNFESEGFQLSQAPYSGNFKIVYLNNEVKAVFCLTRQGNLLIQSVDEQAIFQSILNSCLGENIPLKGLLGEWNFCKLFWQFLKSKKVIQEETHISKEILYEIDLASFSPSDQPNVQILTAEDYPQWKPLRLHYVEEAGLPNELTDKQLSDIFIGKCEKKIIWGFFIDEQLVSTAELNASTFDLGQLGGVYTEPKFRKKGFSKAVIYKLCADLKNVHHMRKLVIFTGEENLPARKLYESIGVTQVGYFALLFGR